MRPLPELFLAKRRQDLPKHLVILLFLAIELFPLYMMLQISLKDNLSFINNPWLPTAPGEWQWENWIFGIRLVGPYIANSFFVSVTTTVVTLVFAVMAAYFFGRHKMPCSGLLWAAFLVLMLMPSIANLVPLFAMLDEMRLLNTLWALIFVGVAGAQVFNIFVLRYFIEDLPKDLFEAADIDGAGHLQKIWHIVIPMAAPIIGTLGILAFLQQWNDFLLPLLVLRDEELFTIGVGLIYLESEYVKQWGQIMAAFFISAVPLIIMFLFTMRLFVRGLSEGAIK